ncbi:glycosyltransferase [Marinilabilia salmonicolor]|uniref:glycosyltransferase n=1 Tax=Marinilabilia salmonicolor TaxID=989 RepID=UPI00029AAD44|nr:glycosyltransferase [Marinilabilia salmonicolor]
MKIVLINSIGKNKWGGGEKWMVMAATGLMSMGHNVVVVCRKNSVLSKRANAENLTVEEIAANSDFDLIACWQFCRFFKEFQPEAVIGCQNKDWRVASVALKTIGSAAKVYSRQGLQLLKNHWWYKWTVRLFCDGIITNTHTIKKEYESFLPVEKDFIKVVFNGVEKVPQNVSTFDYREYIPSEENDPIIVLSTGRLAKQKGFKYLISVAADIIQQHPNVYFFLAGRGKLEDKLKTQVEKLGIEKNFIFLGFVEDIHPLLKAADVFVFPSLYEGMPNSLLEAMAHGLLVISSNVNGVQELIEDGVNGYTVEPGNVDSLYNVLNHVVSNRSDISILGEKARHFIFDNFAVEKMVKNLNGVLCVNKTVDS